ncbi:MAG: bifunctional aspartate kinase/homoserine dehydrogenase I, partial [Eudoraea sp.]|nr:bifunctional aspartate kinase/homoserine dehydrogenase I [Eudoraea sp.]
ESFKQRFKRSTNEELQLFNVESWLIHHGKKLQERFQLSAYKLTNQLLKTIDITREGEEAFKTLQESDTNIHIIGVDSDLFFSASENRETYRQLARAKGNVTYGEIRSVHGHDAFLMEFDQMEQLLSPIFNPEDQESRWKILKFGGKSLSNGTGINRVLQLIESRVSNGERIAVVLSAREKATDQLKQLLQLAANGDDYAEELNHFNSYQQNGQNEVDLSEEFNELSRLLEGVALLGDYSDRIKDQVLAQGELIAVKMISALLKARGVEAVVLDSRNLIKTDDTFGNAKLIERLSRASTEEAFNALSPKSVPLVTGFIASTEAGETTTLGRNGSNYTAALIANFLDAEELQNYTHVDGIYTANPELVADARKIKQLSYEEANELANFGTSVLHAKTIIPLLEKNIPLRILNTFNDDNEGTRICSDSEAEGIKAISVIDDEALIVLEGRGLLGKVGVDARIFGTLGQYGINVSIISQGSSERGIGVVVKADQADLAKKALTRAFEADFQSRDINAVNIYRDVAIISIVGIELGTFHKPFNALIKNQIHPLLFNNSVTGNNVGLVVKRSDLHKALNVIHGQVFGINKKINLAIFGHGQVGGALVDQLLESVESIEKRKGIHLNIFALANSRRVLLNKSGIRGDWKSQLEQEGERYSIEDIIAYAQKHHLENLIAVDNTANKTFVEQYRQLLQNGFDLVSSNKIANTLSFDFYSDLRQELKENQKTYLYETNVGAGLPLIDTIKLLHLSGENITGIKGVFSGSLSYIFNTLSETDLPFSEIVAKAKALGYTEPDPREDLSGNDVGRKLLVLARELDLQNEFDEIQIENLIPEEMRELSLEEFTHALPALDKVFQKLKDELKPGNVLRYVGELKGDLQKSKGELEVKLISVPKNSTLGQVKGSDSLIEIFMESYGSQPLVIQGAGAGASVTARGVFGDILRIAEKL